MSGSITIDGTSQPGYGGTQPVIVLSGASESGGSSGLELSGDGASVLGLAIDGFSYDAINLQSSFDLIESASSGPIVAGTAGVGNDVGVEVTVAFNTIGGTTPGQGNLISGNTSDGVDINGAGSAGNLVVGNLIGTDLAGTVAIANGGYGVNVFFGGRDNTIGGTASGAGNLISGNTVGGVGDSDQYDVIAGNLIGTDTTGTVAIPNVGDGVDLGGSNDTVGGTAAGALNVISGNTYGGIVVTGTNELIEGNLIGTTESGAAGLANDYGIETLAGATGLTIGGTAAGAGNVISASEADGVGLGASGTLLEGNKIGTNSRGLSGAGGTLIAA